MDLPNWVLFLISRPDKAKPVAKQGRKATGPELNVQLYCVGISCALNNAANAVDNTMTDHSVPDGRVAGLN